MNSNAHFDKGSLHDVCQDYALSGYFNENIAYLIVSDGCSASHELCRQVDFGARILAHSAKNYLYKIFNYLDNIRVFNKNSFVKQLSNDIILDAESIRQRLDLSPFALDATLLIAISDKNKTLIFLYGDGGFIINRKNGEINFTEITFSSGAPFYLSYSLDPLRMEGYMHEFGHREVLITDYKITNMFSQSNIKQTHIGENIYLETCYEIKDASIISLVSDGVKSFQKECQGDFSGIAVPKIITEFSSFKNTNGNFVKRRIHALKRQFQKDSISHYDDISMASVVL